MCTTCGCGGNHAVIETITTPHYRHAERATATGPYVLGWDFHPGGRWQSQAHAAEPMSPAPFGSAQPRTIEVDRDVLERNNALAECNRHWLAERGILLVNLMSSPGSGKTTILTRTIAAWNRRTPVGVIEGDRQTSLDAERIRATGVPALQVNTGRGCHLDACMVGAAIAELDPPPGSLLFIENVGNLVCPSAFKLGETLRVVILSVTEDEDKPLKYPDMFATADLLLINKVDLAPSVKFDLARAIGHAQRVRPGLEAITLSAKTGVGFARWLDWLERGVAAQRVLRAEMAMRPATWDTALPVAGSNP
jgi:hydrogenase nickel incorporation protein HypB